MTTTLPYVGDEQVRQLGYPRAVRAIETALGEGVDPSADPARTSTSLGAGGRLLLMPSLAGGDLGVKLVTINPGNAGRGRPVIHGVYVLFDPQSYAPVAVLDGSALTTLRTPAVSVAATRAALRRFDRPLEMVVFGVGPQGVGHLDAFCALATHEDDFPPPGRVTFVTRQDPRDRLPPRPGVDISGLCADDPAVPAVLARADLVVCASSARRPLFDSSLLDDRTVVVAVGTSTPDASEVDTGWCARATVIVEDRMTAFRESGEIVDAHAEGVLREGDLVPMSEAVGGRRDLSTGPVLFKGSGMAWQDLVIARAVVA